MYRAAILLAVTCAAACSSNEAASTKTPQPLGCARLGGVDDCFAAFRARVDACLGMTVSGGMDYDNRSCGSEATGVVFHSQALGAAQHFTVTANGRACLEWTREVGSNDFVAVSEGETLKLMGNTLTCPDGRTLSLDPNAAAGCADRVPGGRYESSAYVQFQLSGSERPQFRCDFLDGTFGDGGLDG